MKQYEKTVGKNGCRERRYVHR